MQPYPFYSAQIKTPRNKKKETNYTQKTINNKIITMSAYQHCKTCIKSRLCDWIKHHNKNISLHIKIKKAWRESYAPSTLLSSSWVFHWFAK